MANKSKSVQMSSASPSPLSRRTFLGRVGVSTAVAATAVGMPSLLGNKVLASQEALSPDFAGIIPEGELSGGEGGERRRERAFRTRIRAATEEFHVPIPRQVNNGDEARYPNRIGNYSKGLPHDGIGEVDPAAYDALLAAIASGDPDDFERIPLGGTAKLANPQSGLAFELEGTDSGQLTIPPAPRLDSAERAGEMVEDYWMALAREIPFSQYGSEPVTAAAIAELNALSDFRGPKVDGRVTPGTLFRGSMPGDLIGPYISQFLLLSVKFGGLAIAQKYETHRAGVDYLVDFGLWRDCQNGRPFGSVDISRDRRILAAAEWGPHQSRQPIPKIYQSERRHHFWKSAHPVLAERSLDRGAQGRVPSEVVRAPYATPRSVRGPCSQHAHPYRRVPTPWRRAELASSQRDLQQARHLPVAAR